MFPIQSILDSDLYKFTQMQAVLELYPEAQAEYGLTIRKPVRFNGSFRDKFQASLHEMAEVGSDAESIKKLGKRCPFLKPHFLSHLATYRFDPNEVSFAIDEKDLLNVKILGPWHRTILWEVPLMALISQLYFEHVDTNWQLTPPPPKYPWNFDQLAKAAEKAKALSEAGCRWADFGTRRRRCFEVQNIVVDVMKPYPGFIGTSNVHLALKHNVTPIGTMAHEWIMGVSALEGLRHANRIALQKWNEVYKGNLGIALTDTYTTDVFYNDFDLNLAKLYDGVRHDSSCPFKFIDKTYEFFKKKKIEPTSKSCVFSDNLNTEKAIAIHQACKGKLNDVFGIGTFLTNDFENSPPLNMVIKLWKLDGIPVVKLSDDLGKAQGDAEALRVAKWTFFNQPLDGE